MEQSIPPFFLPGEAERTYENLRDCPFLSQLKTQIEKDWALFYSIGLSDPGAKQATQAKTHFQGVFWELYLAKLLHKQGYPLFKTGSKGPDFSFEAQGKPVHIECIAPNPGNSLDAIPEPTEEHYGLASIVRYPDHGLPEREIHLRLTNALDEKFKKFDQYIADKTIEPSTHCIIAINGYNLSPFIKLGLIPPICRVLFGVGQLYSSQDSKQLFFQYQTELLKSNKKPVSSVFFENQSHSIISGILYADNDVANSAPLLYIPNPHADNPIPETLFDFCHIYTPHAMDNGFVLKIKKPIEQKQD